MYLDNGTTFVSAHRQIQELYDIYNDQQVQSELKDFLRELEISWSFIPPHLILKIAVKSAKYHVGTTLNGLPCVDLSDVNENKLLQWQRVEQTQ